MFGAGLLTPPIDRPQFSRGAGETFGQSTWLGQETGHNPKTTNMQKTTRRADALPLAVAEN
jgi:hypothetical protein